MPRHPHEPVTPTLPFPPMPPAPPCGCMPPRMRPEPFSPGGLPAPHGFDFGRWAREKINWLLSLVPSEADADNQLADKAWVEQQTGELGNGKADKVAGAAEGNLAGLDAEGNLTDSGTKPADFATAAQGAKADTAVQPAAIAGFVDGAGYDAEYGDPPKPTILLKHGDEVVATVDAADFVIDGMVSDVEVKNGNLVITFNTDSGKQPISIPLTDIFDPANYYDKDAVNALLNAKQDALTFDNAPTTGSNNPVKSGGIWSALWGALSALPTGFTSLYDWCVSQLAGKASKSDATLTERGPNHDGFSAWEITWVNPAYPNPIDGVTWYDGAWWLTVHGQVEVNTGISDRNVVSIDVPAAKATRTALQGYLLGSQTDKPLASEAEAEALRNGKLDNSSTGWVVSYTEGGLRIADDTGVYYIEIGPGRIRTNYPDAHNVYWPTNGGTIALLENLAGNFSSSTAYAKDALVVYMGALYRCVNPNGHTGAWVAADFAVATVEDVLAALRTGKANRAANPTAGNLAALDANGNPTDSGVKASDKLDSTSAAPAFSTSSTYAVGDHVTYNGALYRCTTAVTTAGAWTGSTNWTAEDMTTPDATLDVTTTDKLLRLVATNGDIIWGQGYNLSTTSSATVLTEQVSAFTFAADAASDQAIVLPTMAAGKVGDFILDVTNLSANDRSLTLTGLDSAFSVVVKAGDDLSETLTVAAGEMARFYFTMTAFRVNSLPTWQVAKEAVENGGAQS